MALATFVPFRETPCATNDHFPEWGETVGDRMRSYGRALVALIRRILQLTQYLCLYREVIFHRNLSMISKTFGSLPVTVTPGHSRVYHNNRVFQNSASTAEIHRSYSGNDIPIIKVHLPCFTQRQSVGPAGAYDKLTCK